MNRQPKGTMGATKNHKPGTFAATTHTPSSTDLSPETIPMPAHLEDAGFSGQLIKATEAEESDYLIDGHQLKWVSPAGRTFLIGQDWDGDPGSVAKDEDNEDVSTFSSAGLSQAEGLRSLVRDRVCGEAVESALPQGVPQETWFNYRTNEVVVHTDGPSAGYTLKYSVGDRAVKVSGTYDYERSLPAEEIKNLQDRFTGGDGRDLNQWFESVLDTMGKDPDTDPALANLLAK